MSEILDEPPRNQQTQPVKQQPTQPQYTNPSFIPKPSAPPQYSVPQYSVTQPYTYAAMPPVSPYKPQSQMPPWATSVYQTTQTQIQPQMRYIVQTQYPPQTQYPVMYPPQQQQQQSSMGMAVAGGLVAGALAADILDDNPF